jgi:site-specific DNA recombinase
LVPAILLNVKAKAVLDHAVIAPGTPGSRSLDINRVQPHWRI